MGNVGFLLDGIIILVYFAVILMIGLYMGRRENTLHDFALGGRNVPWWAVMASIIAAETSAATYLGLPSEGFKYRGIVYAQMAIGLILGRILVSIIFLKPYYTYKVYTVYDYLSIRFGNLTKNYVSALFLVMRTLGSGARLFVPSLVMVLAWQAMKQGGTVDFTTIKGSALTPYVWAIILLTVLTCVYTALGGIKAVIWTDVVQATLMFGTALLAICTLIYHVGGDSLNPTRGLIALTNLVPELKSLEGYLFLGWEEIRIREWISEQEKARRVLETPLPWTEYIRIFLANPYTIVSAIIANTIGNMAAFGTDQDMVQRLLTAETYKKSRRSLITAAFMDLPIYAVFSFIGVLLIAYYQMYPRFKPADNADVFASYIINVVPVGLRGLILAGVFATAMGSLSAALNALATSATNDWYIPYLARDKEPSHHVFAARVFTIIFAVLMVLIAVVSAYVKVQNSEFRIIPYVIGIAGLLLGPMLGVFLLGMLTRTRGSDTGNMIAITLGLVGIFFLSGQHVDLLNILDPAPKDMPVKHVLPAWLPKITWTWYAAVGGFIVFAVGLLFHTPEAVQREAKHRADQATHGEDIPLHLRG